MIGLVSLGGCLDVTTTSTVNNDGSIVRTMTFSGDSSEVYGEKFPVVLDSTWSKTVERLMRLKGQDKRFKLTASRSFRNTEEMNDVLKGTFGRTLQYKFELEKSFRWFFTVYRYRETTLPYEQFTSIPMTEFLSRDEIRWTTNRLLDKGDTSDVTVTRGDSLAFESVSPRLKEYEWRNLFEPLFAAFLEGVKSLNNPSLAPATIEPFKDSLYRCSKKALDKGNIDTLRIIFGRVLRNPLVEKAWRASEPGFAEIDRRMEFEHRTNSHTYVTTVVMPGLITGSDAGKIEGNTATWQDYKDHAHYLGVTMHVESRRVNWWAVVLALAAVAALAVLLIASVVRRRRVI
jgi:hypothetical protein